MHFCNNLVNTRQQVYCDFFSYQVQFLFYFRLVFNISIIHVRWSMSIQNHKSERLAVWVFIWRLEWETNQNKTAAWDRSWIARECECCKNHQFLAMYVFICIFVWENNSSSRILLIKSLEGSKTAQYNNTNINLKKWSLSNLEDTTVFNTC